MKTNLVTVKANVSTRSIMRSLGIVSAIAFGLVGVGCSESEAKIQDASKTQHVESFTIEKYADVREGVILGRVRAPKELNLAFELAGKVEWIATTTGQRFQAGERLGVLDAKRYQLAFDAADQRLAFANKELQRMEKLLKGGSCTVSEFDRAQNAALLARIAWESAKQDLDDCVLYAPFDGKLAAKKVEVGSFVGPGQPVLVYQETGATEVDIYQTESQLFKLLSGLRDGSITMTLNEEGVENAELQLKDYATTPDSFTGSYRTTLLVKDSTADFLLPGVPVRILVRESLNVAGESPVDIPANALVSQLGGGFQVWVLEEGATAAKARTVSLGQVGARSVEILRGLSIGDRVVTSGSTLIRSDSVVSTELNF